MTDTFHDRYDTVRTIDELKNRYNGKWLAIQVTRYERHFPVEGKLLYHDADLPTILRHVESTEGLKELEPFFLYSPPTLP